MSLQLERIITAELAIDSKYPLVQCNPPPNTYIICGEWTGTSIERIIKRK